MRVFHLKTKWTETFEKIETREQNLVHAEAYMESKTFYFRRPQAFVLLDSYFKSHVKTANGIANDL